MQYSTIDNSINKSVSIFCTGDYTVKRKPSPREVFGRASAMNTVRNSSVVHHTPNKSMNKSKGLSEILNLTGLGDKSSVTFEDLSGDNSFNLLDKHIGNIERDIEKLAVMFHDKLLKDRVLRGLKIQHEEHLEKLDKAEQLSSNSMMIKFFYAWVYFINTNKRKSVLLQTISSITTKIPKPNAFNSPAVQYPYTQRAQGNEKYRKREYLHYSEGKFDQYDGA